MTDTAAEPVESTVKVEYCGPSHSMTVDGVQYVVGEAREMAQRAFHRVTHDAGLIAEHHRWHVHEVAPAEAAPVDQPAEEMAAKPVKATSPAPAPEGPPSA